MAVRNWKQISSIELIGEQKFGKGLTRKRLLDPDGCEHEFFGYILKPSVVIMPVTADGMVVTTVEFKQGSMMTQQNFPAGYPKKVAGVLETLEQAAIARLQDKAGYCVGEIVKLGRKFIIPRHSDGYVEFYLAFDCMPSNEQKLDMSDGDIDVVLVPLIEWLRKVENDETSEMFTVTASTLAMPHLRKRGLIV